MSSPDNTRNTTTPKAIRHLEKVFETANRTGMIADPFGHKWHVSTRKEEVSPKEMQRGWGEMFR